MGFAAGQLGSSGSDAEVIYCRGLIDSRDGSCGDLVVDLQKGTTWRIIDVRYYGFDGEPMHLSVPAEPHLTAQLEQLARTIVGDLRRN